MDTDKSTNVESTYSFGLPGSLVWITHIVVGAMLAYIGYNILNKKSLNPNWGILLLVLGVMVGFYHAHLWYLNKSKSKAPKHIDQPYYDITMSPAPQAYNIY